MGLLKYWKGRHIIVKRQVCVLFSSCAHELGMSTRVHEFIANNVANCGHLRSLETIALYFVKEFDLIFPGHLGRLRGQVVKAGTAVQRNRPEAAFVEPVLGAKSVHVIGGARFQRQVICTF
jgi:hypothetical protein